LLNREFCFHSQQWASFLEDELRCHDFEIFARGNIEISCKNFDYFPDLLSAHRLPHFRATWKSLAISRVPQASFFRKDHAANARGRQDLSAFNNAALCVLAFTPRSAFQDFSKAR